MCYSFFILKLRPCRRPPYMQEPADLQCCQLWAISVRCLNWDIMWVLLCWEWSDYYHRQECSLFDRNCEHILLHVMWEYNLFRAIHSFLLEATWRHWCTVEWGGRFLQPSEAKAIVNLLNIHRFKLKVKQIFETYVVFVKKLIKSLIHLKIRFQFKEVCQIVNTFDKVILKVEKN